MKLGKGSYRIIGIPKLAKSVSVSASIRNAGNQITPITNNVKPAVSTDTHRMVLRFSAV